MLKVINVSKKYGDLVAVDNLSFEVKDGEIFEKKKLNLPKQVTNVISRKNPRCITTVEPDIPHVFKLTEREKVPN